MLEKLESRYLLAVSASITDPGPNGILKVEGDNLGNDIDLSVSGTDLVIDGDYIQERPSVQLSRGRVSGRRLLVGVSCQIYRYLPYSVVHS